MKVVRPFLAFVFALAVALLPALSRAADSLTCTGRFPNPITEICWMPRRRISVPC